MGLPPGLTQSVAAHRMPPPRGAGNDFWRGLAGSRPPNRAVGFLPLPLGSQGGWGFCLGLPNLLPLTKCPRPKGRGTISGAVWRAVARQTAPLGFSPCLWDRRGDRASAWAYPICCRSQNAPAPRGGERFLARFGGQSPAKPRRWVSPLAFGIAGEIGLPPWAYPICCRSQNAPAPRGGERFLARFGGQSPAKPRRWVSPLAFGIAGGMGLPPGLTQSVAAHRMPPPRGAGNFFGCCFSGRSPRKTALWAFPFLKLGRGNPHLRAKWGATHPILPALKNSPPLGAGLGVGENPSKQLPSGNGFAEYQIRITIR